MSDTTSYIVGIILGASLSLNMIFFMGLVYQHRHFRQRAKKEIEEWDKRNGFIDREEDPPLALHERQH